MSEKELYQLKNDADRRLQEFCLMQWAETDKNFRCQVRENLYQANAALYFRIREVRGY
jgi:hypothetical protein